MKRYQLASDFWEGPSVIVRASDSRGDRIATFPIDFLRRGGDNTWSYVYGVIAELVVHEGPASRSVILDEKGKEVDHGQAPSAGQFFFNKQDGNIDDHTRR